MKLLEVGADVRLKNVLFATDFSNYSNAALPYAMAIAKQNGVKLFAAHVLTPETYLFVGPETWPAMIDQQNEFQRMDSERLEEQLRGVPHQVLTPVGDIPDVVFRLIRDHGIELLVLGTHGRSGLPKLLMGSVAEKIFRQSPIPVLTVGPNVPRKEGTAAQFRKIVFATDFSDESLAALPHALSLAQEHHARLFVLHVMEEPAAGNVDRDADISFAVRRMEEMVPEAPEIGIEPEYFVEFGKAAEQVRSFAEEQGADLIVLGVRSKDGSMGTHLVNTTAQRIIGYATCPVLTVRG